MLRKEMKNRILGFREIELKIIDENTMAIVIENQG